MKPVSGRPFHSEKGGTHNKIIFAQPTLKLTHEKFDRAYICEYWHNVQAKWFRIIRIILNDLDTHIE